MSQTTETPNVGAPTVNVPPINLPPDLKRLGEEQLAEAKKMAVIGGCVMAAGAAFLFAAGYLTCKVLNSD